MDFVTHTLIGVGLARLLAPDAALRPQICLAALLASLLPDSDSLLGAFSQDLYGRYHRVVTHSILGLTVITGLSAGLAWAISHQERARRFGWYVLPNQPPDSHPARVGWAMLLLAGAIGATAHWVGDWITAFGNLTPWWPWVVSDVSLGAVNSFDPVLLTATLCWHVGTRMREWPPRAELLGAVIWFVVCASYVIIRPMFGDPAVY